MSDDPEMDALIEAINRADKLTPIPEKVAILRRNRLERCLRWRKMISRTKYKETLTFYLKMEQRGFVDLRRYRESGIWPTLN